jgi:hypothetical protein
MSSTPGYMQPEGNAAKRAGIRKKQDRVDRRQSTD